MFIDTHCHLNFPDYQNDLDQVVKNSVDSGVEKIICASSNLEDSKRAVGLAQKYPGIIYALVGIHPQQTDPENSDSLDSQLNQLDKLVKSPGIVGIGECGLDYSSAPPGEKNRTKEEQYSLFEGQIKLAQKYNLPISIHSRKAYDETLDFLASRIPFPVSSYLQGVWHCYSGGKSKIQKVIELGLYFGIDGNITYDDGLQNVVKEIPLEKIVLETDSPFLSPLPSRSLRNEPKNVKITAEFLAKIKSIPFDKVVEITTQNAVQIFKLN
jgi:TatD DNase family protein